MRTRPTAITVLAVYLMLVFSVSLFGNMYGAATAAEPYDANTWLLLALPKVLAVAAGVALWRMLRLGAYLWAASIVLGWTLAIIVNTGFFPNFSAAVLISLIIIGASAWVLMKNWSNLRAIGDEQHSEGSINA